MGALSSLGGGSTVDLPPASISVQHCWEPTAPWVDSSLWAHYHCIARVGGSGYRPLGSEARLLAWGAPAACSPGLGRVGLPLLAAW